MRNSPFQVFKGGWEELSNAVHTPNISPFAISPKSHFIRFDGSTIFVTSGTNVEAYVINRLYDIDTISGIVIATFPITVDTNPHGIAFSHDGSMMIIAGRNTKTLYQYNLPTHWDITSIVAPPTTMSLASVGTLVDQCVFSRDGNYVFVTDDIDVHSFPLPTPFDIASNVTTTTFSPIGLHIDGIAFKPEGDKMYLSDELVDKIFEFDLSPIWDITTAGSPSNELITGLASLDSISFRSNGRELFISDNLGNMFKFHADEAWRSIEDFSHFTNTEPIPTASPRAITWVPDGMSYIIADFTDDTIKQYSVPHKYNQTGAVLDGSPFDISGIQNRVNGMWWERNGMYCYIIGLQQDRLTKLNVTSPYDVSTMSAEPFTQPSGLTFPTGIYFNDDESKAYISDTGLEGINEYELTTPGDTTTMNLVDFLPTNVTAPDPQDILLDPTETIVYVIAADADQISRYTKRKNETISNAVFIDSLDISNEETFAMGFFIRRDNGRKVYVVGSDSLSVISYDMIPLVP